MARDDRSVLDKRECDSPEIKREERLQQLERQVCPDPVALLGLKPQVVDVLAVDAQPRHHVGWRVNRP